MKISLLGNCQTKALSWYLEQLNKSFDVKWISIERFYSKWGPEPHFKGKKINVIADTEEGIKRLQSSDLVIFQNISAKTSKNYNVKKLKTYTKNSKLISISSMMYNAADPKQTYLKGMIQRAKEHNLDIPAHKIIEKHGSKIKMQKHNHPNVFYFLELVREICIKMGWNYYTDEKYDQYLKEGYPFG